MQVLVLFHSRSGNTKTLAESIVKGVKKTENIKCIIKNTEEISEADFLDSDAIIAGAPVYFGTMSYQLKEVFDKFVGLRPKMQNKIGAAFTTSGHSHGGNETTMLSIIQAMLIYGMIIVGDPLSATGHYGVAATGKPDPVSCENAEKLGQRVAELVKKMKA